LNDVKKITYDPEILKYFTNYFQKMQTIEEMRPIDEKIVNIDIEIINAKIKLYELELKKSKLQLLNLTTH